MSQYFNNFPNISYNGSTIKNLTLRAKVIDAFKTNATNFYPYTVKDTETADALAADYYGDPNYVWIVYYCNDIVDPYYDWPLSTVEFEKFIAKKYESNPGYNDGISVAKSTTSYYKKIPVDYYINDATNEYILASLYDPSVNGYNWTQVTMDEDVRISSATTPNPAEWVEVDVYTYENELNEKKKQLKLLDRRYVGVIENQLKDILNA